MRLRAFLTPATVILVLLAAIKANVPLGADQVVLVPGIINGTVTIGNLVISQIQLNATPSGGTASTLVQSPNTPAAPYSMTVSVAQAGTTPVSLTAFIRTDQNRDLLRFNTVTAAVSASQPAQQDFTVDAPGFIAPSFTVTGGATLSSVSLTATYSSGSIFEQASTSAAATVNMIFPTIPRAGISLTGSVVLSNGLQVPLPARTIDVAANGTTSVAYTVDGTATGSVGGTISFAGPLTPQRVDVSVSGTTSKSLIQQPPPANGIYSVGPLVAGSGYSLTTTARFNNFDDAFTFPSSAYSPGRSNLTVGTGETSVNVAAEQAFINGTVQLTGASSLQPFVSSGSVLVSGANNATSGGSSQDQLTVPTRAFDLIVSPGSWRFNQTLVSFSRSAPSLSGNFFFFDNRSSSATTVAAGDAATFDIPIALGEVTLTMTVAGGGTLSNPSVNGSCVQRDDSNNLLWSTSFNFSTSGQNNVTEGSVTFATPSGQCSVTPRAVINGQTVALPTSTVQVIAGSSQTVDVGGPTLTITSPAPEAIVSASSIFVSGKASDDVAVASVTVNGVATNLSSAGNPADPPQVNFSTVSAVALQRGPNVLTTVAKDSASPQNSTTDTRTVYWDTALPTLSFTPANSVSTFANSVSVAGTASDDAGVKKITVNGVDTPFTSTGNPALPKEVTFSATTPLVVGSNAITVVVTDISNRTTTQVHNVIRQQQATTTLTVNAAAGTYNGSIVVSATLLSEGIGVPGKVIHFAVNGNAADATTNANGVATAPSLSVSGLNVSVYVGGIAASFDGDADLRASNGTGTLTITKASATLSLAGLSTTYDGTPKAVSTSTSPAGLTGVSVTYNGSATAPTNAGSYAVVASLTNDNYQASNATGTLVIAKASATLSLGSLSQTYDGAPKAATASTTPSGLSGVTLMYDGYPSPPTNAGSYGVVASLNNANYQAADANGTLVIGKAAATLTLSNLFQTYDGSPKSVVATTSPAGLSGVSLTYNGSPTAPANAGSYAVVAALQNANYSAPNATGVLDVAKAEQRITFGALANKTFGDADFAVTASSSSGLPVAFAAVSGPCSVTGNSVHITAAGSCTVRASQTGSANYQAAPDVTQSVNIGKAAQTITFGSLSNKLVGDAPFTVSATASSGLPVSFAASGSCAVAGATVTLTGANGCAITATQGGDGNYLSAAPVTQSFLTLQSWSNVLQPINVDGTSVFKLGSTVPVKFRLTGGSAGLLIDARIFLWKLSNGITGSELEATATNDPDGGNAFRYDASSGQYIFNLGTRGITEGTWQIRIDLQDGAPPQARTVMVSLKR